MTTTNTPPAQKQCAYEYTVKRGDSFYLIAHRLGIPLRDLLEANSDVNPARLMVGDVLCIPMEEDDAPAPDAPLPPDAEDSLDQPAQPEAPPADEPPAEPAPAVCRVGSAHVVAEGETVSDVQLRRGLNRHTLEVANPALDLDALSAGQTLCIPDANMPCPVPPTYTLTGDDTLESVALAQNVSVGALLRANPCLAPADFRAGACINVPRR